MKRSFTMAGVAAGALALAACGGTSTTNDTAVVVPADDVAMAPMDNGMAPMVPADNAGVPADAIALGLTESQLLDADLRDSGGNVIGDVEAVERDGSGNVSHLVIQIEDTDPDRYVRVPIDGLERVADGSDWDVRGPFSRTQLMEMPAITR